MPPSQPILCCTLLLLPPIPPSVRVFSNESTLPMRWPKYWSFSLRISPSNEHPELISFRMDWLDLLADQETLRSLLQHYSSKASILLHSVFFTVHLSRPYMTTGKTIALTRWTFVGKVMSLLFFFLVFFFFNLTLLYCIGFAIYQNESTTGIWSLLLNMLFRLVITFLQRSKHLLTSRLQSPAAVILEPKKIKSDTVSTVPMYLSWSDGTGCHDLCFLNAEL